MNPISHFVLELKLNQMELYRSICNLTSFQFYFFKIYTFPPLNNTFIRFCIFAPPTFITIVQMFRAQLQGCPSQFPGLWTVEIVIYMLCGSPSWELWQATLYIQTIAILGIHFSVKWFLFSLWCKKCTIQTIWDKNMHILVLYFFMLVPPVNYGLSYFKNA